MISPPLVSVIIPAYNAAKTIDETLHSVRAQSHTALEIIIIDDGSKDETSAIAARHANVDSRIRLIQQANAGVAAARNTGWMAASAELIALLDADDLWDPAKIELQLAALARGGVKVGLVYCFYTRIDGDGMVTESWESPGIEGDVLDEILRENFVGGIGSSILVRREALVSVGGFESSFRMAGAEGCDDYMFCCKVAEAFYFAVVPEILVGYRDVSGSLSSDPERMLHSRMMATDELIIRHPDKRAILLRGQRIFAEWLIRRIIFQRRPRHVIPLLIMLFRHYPRIGLIVLAQDMPNLGFVLAERLRRRIVRKICRVKITKPKRVRFNTGTVPVVKEIG